MIIDMHNHTNVYSPCSILAPHDLVRRAEEVKLDAIVITEHSHVWTEEEVGRLRTETGTGLLIFRGQEIVTSIGDLLVLGYYHDIGRDAETEEVIAWVHAAGGIVILAHPFRGRRDLGASAEHLHKRFAPVDGIEVYNGNQTEYENAFAAGIWQSLDVTGIGGSDSHSLPMIGRFATEFDDIIRSEEMLVSAIRNRLCRPVARTYASFRAALP